MTRFYDIAIDGLDSQPLNLADFKNKAILVVNVASACGLTPQYKGLQALYQQYKDKGLVVLGVPCNQFGQQEPGSNEEIADFCTTKFAVDFPMTTKVEVNGENRHPLYQFLVEDGDDIEWNFAKFLINKEGHVIQRFGAKQEPQSAEIMHAIVQAL
ncbi:glutathione peroxidase [Bermanella sp. WJH001]|uniref:glutathione peroxidase n=1 Tax=Bermanella sp. WJH001 TaxID=3048005 RepID=UPI0024BE1BFA|nr:glutathione peroxidase [Bermanella sp. WJH001]MDJ1539317.1 glutathione peroxidase [Bermanella sp. WJH001]